MRRLWMIAVLLALGAGTAHAQQAVQPIDLSPAGDKLAKKDITPPKLTHSATAEFPDEARRRQISGLCLVSMTIDVSGKPQDAKIIRCTDHAFEKSSLNAVKQYRFDPATTHDGKPVSVKLEALIDTRANGWGIPGQRISCEFGSPPGMTSNNPGPDGVYPLTKKDTPPAMTKFSDEGYGDAVFLLPGDSLCDIALTISLKGKASDPQVVHCDSKTLEMPAVASLLNSRYKPGQAGGISVPMRVTLRLEYWSTPPNAQAMAK